jgi:hypothetical protein
MYTGPVGDFIAFLKRSFFKNYLGGPFFSLPNPPSSLVCTLASFQKKMLKLL